VTDLIDRYLSEGPSTKLNKRESSWRIDASNLRCHVAPLIGTIELGDLTRDHIAGMVSDTITGKTAVRHATGRQGGVHVRGGAGCAHIVYRTARAMFYWAIGRDLMERNPAVGIELPRRPMVGRFLTLDEAKRMLVTLAELERIGAVNPQHGAAIRLLLYTGARRSEICGLHWSEIDHVHRRLVLPPERCKTGGKTGERRIPLNEPAIQILANLPKDAALVFPAERTNVRGHMTGLDKSWKKLRAAADLGSPRLHDLRHSFASFALANGENIVSISAVLGHSGIRTTQRYLHLHDTAGAELSERTARLFA
jgi:integrase